jgi:DNA-binding HxlR family transcriptional regulator
LNTLKKQVIDSKRQAPYGGDVTKKSYDQYCGIAAALDRVGDRWTLLVLRELSFGERRFTDLRTALPGIATNLLTERLRDLEEDGLVEQRELPAPASRTVYALTDEGKRIRPVLRALFGFGLPYLEAAADRAVRPRMAVHGALTALFDPVAAVGTELVVRFDFDFDGEGETLGLQVDDGRLVRPAPEAKPDLVVSGSAAALVEVCRGAAGLDEVGDRLHLKGTRSARRDFARVFALAS